MANEEWPSVPFYITEERVKFGIMWLVIVFLSFQWFSAERNLTRLVQSTSNLEDQYWTDVCLIKYRVDGLSEAIGLGPVNLDEM